MIDALLKTRKELFGLDIGSSSIKLVELKKTRKEFKLKGYAIKDVPRETIVDGEVMDSVALADTLRSLLAEYKPSTKFVALSVPGHGVTVRTINVPLVTEDELAQSIQWETEQYLPFNIKDVYVDFKILGESPDNPGQMNVLLVAAKKSAIDEYLLVVNEVGLETLVVDVDVFAMQNMFELNYPIFEGKVTLLCNLGASFTNINIVKAGNSLITRTVNFGGNKITASIQKGLGVTFDEAERIKKGALEGHDKSAVEELIDGELESMILDLRKTIDYFNTQFPNDVIDKIVLFGGTAKLNGIVDKIKDKVGIAVELGNPFTTIGVDKKFQTEKFGDFLQHSGIAVGLAIRRLGDR